MRQVGYLPELHGDARSEMYKIWEVGFKCASIDGGHGWVRRPINVEDSCERIE